MEKITIGIVVPVYKVKKVFLDECINSILNQTYTDIRVALVDDCSPDECGRYCDEYAKTDSRIVVSHHKENKGLPEARNTGIRKLLDVGGPPPGEVTVEVADAPVHGADPPHMFRNFFGIVKAFHSPPYRSREIRTLRRISRTFSGPKPPLVRAFSTGRADCSSPG